MSREPGFGALLRIRAVGRKEVWHILRDWQTLAIVIIMPIAMMFLYGYALSFDFVDVKVVIEDASGCREVRAIAADINATTIFKVVAIVPPSRQSESYFYAHGAKVILRFPADFALGLRRGGSSATVQALIDGADPNLGTILRNALGPAVQNSVLNLLGIEQLKVVSIDSRILYNPDQRSALFFVPGLIAIILTMIGALLTSLTLTREKEYGTLDQLLVSPLRPWEILVGKVTPYAILTLIDGAFILVVGALLFDVRVQGSFLFLVSASTLYVITVLALGLIFSTVAKSQQQAMMMVLPATVLPTIVLSGFIFPIASMPLFLQIVAHLIPATYFLEIVRGIILKGVGPLVLWKNLLALAGIGAVFFVISIRRFNARPTTKKREKKV